MCAYDALHEMSNNFGDTDGDVQIQNQIALV